MIKQLSYLRTLAEAVVVLGAILFVAACTGAPPSTASAPAPAARLQILALNDFHGQLVVRARDGRKVGGAAALKAYFDRERTEFDGETIIAQSGDLVGASSPESALLQDEPTVIFFNSLANDYCGRARDSRCNLVATPGNHEFDEGEEELFRLIDGGRSPKGPFLEDPFEGSKAEYIGTNVIDTRTGKTMLPSFALKNIGGVDVAFLAATTVDTAQLVRPEMVRHTRFKDEAHAINETVALLRGKGVRAFVVLLHEGVEQTPYDGPTRRDVGEIAGRMATIVGALDGEVDVVISGHRHEFTNAFLPNAAGRDVLVTQAFSDGRAYADIELELDPQTKDVSRKTAVIKTVFADQVEPDREIAALEDRVMKMVGPRLKREVGRLSASATREQSAAGESVLGNLITDAHRRAVSADIGFMNPGGLRAELEMGSIDYGDLFAVHPFGNTVVAMTLTGAEIAELLESQWLIKRARILHISGMRYAWSEAAPAGRRVSDIEVGGKPLDPNKRYSVAVNNFLAEGGDGFTVFAKGQNRASGPMDIEALEAYFASSDAPLSPPGLGRIRKK